MSRQFNTYQVKSFGLELKDFDEGSRKVSGYLAAFNIEDSDRDIIMQGAFKQSLNMRGPDTSTNRKIAFLRGHDWSKQIGRFDELEEDSYGLKFVATMGRSAAGEDAFRDYQDGILREHSIGFNYVKDKIKYDEEKEVWYISEVKLFEGSAVTLGANEFTPVLNVAKGANLADELGKVNEEMTAIQTALRNGKGTDERLYKLEMRLAICQRKYNDLLKIQPSKDDIEPDKKDFQQPKPDETKGFLINLLT